MQSCHGRIHGRTTHEGMIAGWRPPMSACARWRGPQIASSHCHNQVSDSTSALRPAHCDLAAGASDRATKTASQSRTELMLGKGEGRCQTGFAKRSLRSQAPSNPSSPTRPHAQPTEGEFEICLHQSMSSGRTLHRTGARGTRSIKNSSELLVSSVCLSPTAHTANCKLCPQTFGVCVLCPWTS